MFRTKYDERKIVYSEPGSGIKKVYQLRETKDGEDLVEIGETDLYKYIQSHADSVDIHKILERCAMIEDYGLLNKVPGIYMDITEMPKTLAEAYEQVQNAKDLFNRMPVDIKEKYDNNFVQFISGLGDSKFNNLVEEYVKKLAVKDAPIDKEVKSDES